MELVKAKTKKKYYRNEVNVFGRSLKQMSRIPLSKWSNESKKEEKKSIRAKNCCFKRTNNTRQPFTNRTPIHPISIIVLQMWSEMNIHQKNLKLILIRRLTTL